MTYDNRPPVWCWNRVFYINKYSSNQNPFKILNITHVHFQVLFPDQMISFGFSHWKFVSYHRPRTARAWWHNTGLSNDFRDNKQVYGVDVFCGHADRCAKVQCSTLSTGPRNRAGFVAKKNLTFLETKTWANLYQEARHMPTKVVP